MNKNTEFDGKKAQVTLHQMRDLLGKLSPADLMLTVEAQRDKLDKWRCNLSFSGDLLASMPRVSAELSYGGRKYKKTI
jgi:hypothetical protein